MHDLAEQFGFAFLDAPWLPRAFMVIVATAVLNLVSHYLLRHAAKVTGATENLWDDALIHAARRPLPILIWIVGIAFAAEIVHKHTGDTIFEFVPHARNVGAILCFAWFLLRLSAAASHAIIARHAALGEPVDHTTVDAIGKLVRVSVIVAAILVAMQTLGFSVSGVLAFGGIGGIAVGFAAKDILANFFGGLTVYLDRPFAVGDWIRSPDKEIEGTVEYIGWRHTRVRAFNKNPIYVPNALFTNIVVENPSRMTNRRIKETIGIRYEDMGKMAAIVSDVKTMLRSHPEIDTEKTLIVNFNEFADSSLNFFIYTFTKTTEWVHYHEIKQDILLRVAGIIEQHGAEIAFPTRTLHIEQEVVR